MDDFLCACTESGEIVINRLLTSFEVGKKEQGRLRFCGKQFDTSGYDVIVHVADTYIDIAKHRSPADPG